MRFYHGAYRTLDGLAGSDETRLKLLADRRGRSKSRTRRMTCPACGSEGWRADGVGDICESCLIDLWNYHDAAKEAAAEPDGMAPAFTMSDRSHDLFYPHLEGDTFAEPPETASFRRGSAGPSRIMQSLFCEIFLELAKALPAPPLGRSQAKSVLCGGHNHQGWYFTGAPARLIELLEQLWLFILWNSARVYDDGHADGRDLLMSLNSGSLTVEQMNNATAKRTAEMQRRMDKAAKNDAGHSS